MAMLEVKNLGISFGGLRAVDGLDMTIEKGELYGLIGPNGAGKTTAFNMLTGVYKPTDGVIKLDGEDITGKSTIEINKAGIARTFQNIRLFSELSVLDNVKVGLHNHYKYSTIAGILRCLIFRMNGITKHPIFHMVNSVSWRLPVPLQRNRSFCFWMNRQPA